jgi:hypothetical protein
VTAFLSCGVAEAGDADRGHGQETFRDFMANPGAIPPIARLTPRELAESMTPREAKSLVRELVGLYVTRPDRLQVFKALYATCKAVADQMKSAAQEPPAQDWIVTRMTASRPSASVGKRRTPVIEEALEDTLHDREPDNTLAGMPTDEKSLTE